MTTGRGYRHENSLSLQQEIKARCFHPSAIVAEFTTTDVEQSIPRRFEEQVRKYPESLAVKTTTSQISYQALNQLANRVARVVLIQGTSVHQESGSPGPATSQPGGTAAGRQKPTPEPLALLIEDDILMIACILGVLKAGHIILPLDPSMPPTRLGQILIDAGVRTIVTCEHHFSLARAIAPVPCQILDASRPLAHLDGTDLGLPISPGDPAYIMYTSGSTGQPKGIVHTHRNALHNVMNYTCNFHISPRDRFTSLHSYCFSSAQVDVLTALLDGACLYPWHVKREGMQGLAAWIAREGITILSWSPTPFRHLMATLPSVLPGLHRPNLPDLRIVALGGEPVSTRDLELYQAQLSDACVFVNRLGTTETNNFRLFFANKSTCLPEGRVPVGYPVHGKEVAIVDSAGEPVGFDTVGEITVKSRYLALGYWRRPEQTKKAFQPDPSGANERIYYTGDLGILHEDGCLEQLGRKDFQYKIRGYRVETLEIEMAMEALPAVKECVVVPRTNGTSSEAAEPTATGDAYLAAYFVPDGEPVPKVAELRQGLARILPEYMIPAILTPVDSLPLTPGGKVDRRALPSPDWLDVGLGTPLTNDLNSAVPRDETEKQLTALWEQVLRIRPVGRHDNFFDLGGHSLSVVRLLVDIKREFGVEIPIPIFYNLPTVSGIADWLKHAAEDGLPRASLCQAWSPLVTLRSTGTKVPLFVLPGILGNVFTDLGDLARYLDPGQPVYAFQDSPRNPIKIQDHAALYVRELRRVQPEGPYFFVGICYGAVLAFEMAQQLSEENLSDREATGKRSDRSPSSPTGDQVAFLALVEPARPWFPGLRTYLSFAEFLFGRFVRRAARSMRGESNNHLDSRIPHGRAEVSEFVRLKMKLMANAWALRRYAPRPYSGPVDLFLSEGSIQTPDNPQMDWRNLVRGRLRMHQIPGTHESITGDNGVVIEREHMQVLALKLQASIDEALASEPARPLPYLHAGNLRD